MLGLPWQIAIITLYLGAFHMKKSPGSGALLHDYLPERTPEETLAAASRASRGDHLSPGSESEYAVSGASLACAAAA